ncbi:MAG: 50S ribosomal protein L18 [Planctomycetes bacterium]|nr:50S ribosomal protein L18 [Planctomycetota bacterium]
MADAIRIKHRKKRVKAESLSKRVRGAKERPRLTVFRSLKHMYAQVIDDESGSTIVSSSTLDKDFVKDGSRKNLDAAKLIGKNVAEKAIAKGIKAVRFDRRSYKYHGRVKALADGAREAGLEF